MISNDTALRGKRVYRMSSYAPTRGKVNPKGYVKRELRNGAKSAMQKGGDGMSDTRSGLAARALNMSRRAPRSALGQPKPRNPRARPKVGPGILGRSPVNASTAQHVKINANGMLDLPYDYQSSAEALKMQQEANNSLLDLQMQGQEQTQQYGMGLRNARQGYGLQRAASLNEFSGRGNPFSSGYGLRIGQDATGYNNQINDIETQNTTFNNGLTQQRNQITTGLNDFLRQQSLSRANQLSGQLGTLGYGQSNATARPVPALSRRRTPKPPKKRRR